MVVCGQLAVNFLPSHHYCRIWYWEAFCKWFLKNVFQSVVLLTCIMNLTISQIKWKMSTRLSVWQRFQNVVASEAIKSFIIQSVWIVENGSLYQMTFIILFITFSGNKFVIYIFGLNLNICPTLHRSLWQITNVNGNLETFSNKKAIFDSKMNSVPKLLTRWNGYKFWKFLKTRIFLKIWKIQKILPFLKEFWGLPCREIKQDLNLKIQKVGPKAKRPKRTRRTLQPIPWPCRRRLVKTRGL